MEAPIKPIWHNQRTGRRSSSSRSLYKLQKKKKNVKKASSSSSSSDYEGYTGSLSKSGKPDKRTKEYKRWKKSKKTPKKQVKESSQVLINYYGLPKENKKQQTPFRDMSTEEAANYQLKNPVKPKQEDNVYKGRRYHQQKKEMELKKMQDLKETAKLAIKERELKKMQEQEETAKKERELKKIQEQEETAKKERNQEKPQEFDWVEYYNKQTPGHPSYIDDKIQLEKYKRTLIDDRIQEGKVDGFIAHNMEKDELYAFDNEKLKNMVIDAGVPIEDIVGMDFNKDIKGQLIGLLNR
tara:strand:- start:419 stop:1306 length:888 start_codon:yes stop_codon:yes gene_type:complete